MCMYVYIYVCIYILMHEFELYNEEILFHVSFMHKKLSRS